MKLIGYAYETGRIDFKREDNPWAFGRIDSGMKQSQKDRIRLDPSQAPLEILSAPTNKEEPGWIADMTGVLLSAESIYLQYKAGVEVLRFRRANHGAGKNRTFITLGNQEEMELPARLDLSHESGEPQFTFDSSGSNASVDIIEWRRSVTEGDVGRFAPENTHIEVNVKGIVRPFTFLHEDRVEFNNHSYTFSGEKMLNQFRRVVRKRLKQLEEIAAEEEQAKGGE